MLFAVTYQGQEVVAVLRTEINLDEETTACVIQMNTFVPGQINDEVLGTLAGEITIDGTMCIFDGTMFEITEPFIASISIVSGKATLSGDGGVLDISDIVVMFFQEQEIIPGVAATCQSVEPFVPAE